MAFLWPVLAGLVLLLGSPRLAAQPSSNYVETGGIAWDLTLKNRKTGEPVRLSDYAGKIIFLDLFAYW